MYFKNIKLVVQQL